MRLSPAYQRAFTEMLGSIADWRAPGATVSACWPEHGPSFQPGRGLLVIGRATNGFEDPFVAAEAATATGREAIAAKARAFAEGLLFVLATQSVLFRRNNRDAIRVLACHSGGSSRNRPRWQGPELSLGCIHRVDQSREGGAVEARQRWSLPRAGRSQFTAQHRLTNAEPAERPMEARFARILLHSLTG